MQAVFRPCAREFPAVPGTVPPPAGTQKYLCKATPAFVEYA